MRCKTSERHDSNNTTRKDRHEVLTMKTTTRDNKQTHGVLGALKNKKKKGGDMDMIGMGKKGKYRVTM